MRGELDDTLARMARREELQRRRAAADRSTVEEVIEAVQRVVARHPGLAVTMSVAEGSTTSVVRVEWAGGGIAVAPAVAPAVEPTIVPAVEPTIVPVTEPTVVPAPEPTRVPAGQPTRSPGPPPVASPRPTWPLSGKTVPGWAAAVDGLDPDPAARLAELIRRDPSLLDTSDG